MTQVTQNQQVAAVPANGQQQQNGKETPEQLIARLQAEVARLTAQANDTSAIRFVCHAEGEKFTDKQGKEQVGKGNLVIYGVMGKYPLSLYHSQAQRLIAIVKDGRLEAALKTFDAKLTRKAQQG